MGSSDSLLLIQYRSFGLHKRAEISRRNWWLSASQVELQSSNVTGEVVLPVQPNVNWTWLTRCTSYVQSIAWCACTMLQQWRPVTKKWWLINNYWMLRDWVNVSPVTKQRTCPVGLVNSACEQDKERFLTTKSWEFLDLFSVPQGGLLRRITYCNRLLVICLVSWLLCWLFRWLVSFRLSASRCVSCLTMAATAQLWCYDWLMLSDYKTSGHAVAQLVGALRYKPEGRGFDSRWYQWNFS